MSRYDRPNQRLAAGLLAALRGAFDATPARRPPPPGLGLLDWARRHLPHHFSKPPSAMHVWLADRLDTMQGARGLKVNAIGPRGAAKSTIATLAYPLRCAVEATEPYVWIVSDTKSQARAHLENLRVELVENSALADAWPDACGRGPRWREGSIELRNGVVIEAFGAGQRLRGRRRGASRPTLIVCDDLQNERHIASAALREASAEWFHSTLLPAGTRRTNVVNVATALHREAVAVKLTRSPGWASRTFAALVRWPEAEGLWDEWAEVLRSADRPDPAGDARRFYEANRAAMDRGAAVLWPEEEDLYTLMRLRIELGEAAFEREKQSQPIDPTRCEWPESYFDESVWFDDWPRDLTLRVIALDPSKGADARHGDYSAYVLLGVDRSGLLHVEADLDRRPVARMVADGVRLCTRFRPHAFGVESNQWQQLLAGEFLAEFQRQGLLGVAPCELTNYKNKPMRVRRLGAYLSQRRFRFRRGSASTVLLVEQLRDFPLAAHDDGPDALEMALRLAEDVWRRRTEEPLVETTPGPRSPE
ncbi:hypothetical protein [Botrimarina sp.]|uniref:phage terminase large subunit family protein n=1 Tax=Botrimarina sp. TaxID=2795802 RepID=UPI0032F0703F